jgi:hypothetical protein
MTTCYEFFKDCEDQDFATTQMYQGMMDEYASHAERLLGKYAEFVAYAYLDGVKSAKDLFRENGLRSVHAYAIQSDFTEFEMEYDTYEKNEQDYD